MVYLISAALGGFIGFALFSVACGFGGAGHGTNIPLKIFFPYVFIFRWAHALPRGTPELVQVLFCCFGQYPCYALALSAGYRRRHAVLISCLVIVIHAASVALIWND